MGASYPILVQYLICTAVTVALLLRILGHGTESGRRARWLDSSLLLLALVAGFNYFLGFRSSNWLHSWDLFHTITSVRYSEELGYDGLYEASLVIGTKELGGYEGVEQIRDLRTLRLVDAASLLTSSRCEERFSEERYQAFVRDLEFWRSIIPPKRWQLAFLDKG